LYVFKSLCTPESRTLITTLIIQLGRVLM